MLLLMCPLIGYSFFQAISLYGEASAAGLQSPVLASSLSPLDGVLVPTLGASYVAVTLLFPFVAIRVLGQETESGAPCGRQPLDPEIPGTGFCRTEPRTRLNGVRMSFIKVLPAPRSR
jgi:hypothetical protein